MASSMYNKDLFRQHSYEHGSTSGYLTTINSVMARSGSETGEAGGEAGCCGTRGRGEKCTAGKAKSCMKMFFAQLFSHVGLCALVVGYAIMGAFIFVYLEKDNELNTRMKVQDTKKNTLDQLYNITGSLRHEIIRQELRIESLTNQVHELTKLYKKCDRSRKKTKRFLMSVIKKYRGDNVQLSLDKCYQYCKDHRFSPRVCDEVCSTNEMKDIPCTLWQFDSIRPSKGGTPSIDYATPPYIRVERTTTEEYREDEVTEPPYGFGAAWNATFEDKDFGTNASIFDFFINLFPWRKSDPSNSTGAMEPGHNVTLPRNSTEEDDPGEPGNANPRAKRDTLQSDRPSVIQSKLDTKFLSVINADVSGKLLIPQRILNTPPCSTLTCVINDQRTATVCLSVTEDYNRDQMHAMLRPSTGKEGEEHFNVLYRENWTQAARKVINQFEQIVIRKAKTEGYDGGDSEDTVQWNFSGALLYSVTVITTIGYGNIAPKTNWGRCVTMIYAIFGMPLFLMWASQMGTLLAHSFQFVYSNICCVMCKRGKRKRALSRMRKIEQLGLQKQKSVEPGGGSLEGGSLEKDKLADVSGTNTLSSMGGPKVHQFQVNESDVTSNLSSTATLLPNKARTPVDTPVHLAKPNHPLASPPISVGKKHFPVVTKEIMDPSVKEVLSACAKYNLDHGPNGKEDGHSAEVLEEIRHVEALEVIRNQSTVSVIVNPNSPRSPTSPGPLPRPPQLSEDSTNVINGSTPLATRRARLGHPTVVSVSVEGSNVPVTSLLGSPGIIKSPPPYTPTPVIRALGSRDPSPVASLRLGMEGGSLNGMGSSDKDDNGSSVIKVSVQPRMNDNSSNLQDRVPVLPVLTFVGGYIVLGAVIFSAWENWDFLEGAYFCFITLTTIGFGDFVPGDAVLNDKSEHGQAKLIIACIYVLMGLAVVAMSINLVQEEIIGKFRQLAKDMGIIDDEDDDLVSA